MSKPKKDKLVTFVNGEFHIETTVHLPGVRSRTLRGKPWIATTPTDIRMGCIRFTNDAMLEIIRCMAQQLKSKEPIVHQVGNYGEPEDKHYRIWSTLIREYIGCTWGERGKEDVLHENYNVEFYPTDSKICPTCNS